ncbi:hypothetical protein IT399_02490 [Candidatus Nomurabacteria bacterium]|nr:hypothetical protein [Candidatus Nomurabacteria bacterium]
MTKKIIYTLGVLVVIWIAVYFAFPKKEKVIEETSTPVITYVNASDNLIKVDLPFPGAVTGKEFKVIGQARGYWFFEASFPVEVLDKDGKILAKGIAKAENDWMTEEFVPFSADIKVPESYIGPAVLILRKDNPSDIREKDAHISFPFTIEY